MALYRVFDCVLYTAQLIVLFGFFQMVELPLRHPQLFRAIGVKVRV